MYQALKAAPPRKGVTRLINDEAREIREYQQSKMHFLYCEEHDGLVYRSIGCWPFTKPVPKDETEERAGRELDKERLMESLRSLVYM